MDNTTIVTEIVTNDNGDKVSHYAELIDRYGLGVVIAAAFIFIAMAIVTIMLRSYLKTQRILQQQQQIMFNTILENMTQDKAKEQNEKESHKELIDTFIKISGLIRSSLENVCNLLSADRTAVYVFHNGVNSSHGLPFIKTSCLTEVLKRGSMVSRRITTHQNIPLNTFDKSIMFMVANQCGYIVNTHEEDKWPALINILKSSGVISSAFLSLYDNDNNMLGVIVAEFAEERSVDELNAAIKVLKRESSAITPILDYADYQQKSDK